MSTLSCWCANAVPGLTFEVSSHAVPGLTFQIKLVLLLNMHCRVHWLEWSTCVW